MWRRKAAPSTELDTTQSQATAHRPHTAQEDNQDCWERQGEHWIRHNISLRTTLFTPTDGPGHPPSNTLEPHNHQQLWRRFATPFEWKGATRFTIQKTTDTSRGTTTRSNNTNTMKHTEQEDYANHSNQLHTTPQQTAERNLTHLPCRNWCPICVQGKGRQDNYKKQQARQPIIQVDVAYIKPQQDPKTIPDLTAVDVTTQLCMAVSGQTINDGLHGQQPTSRHPGAEEHRA